MDIEATTQDALSIVRVVGFLDTRASADFEKKMLELLHAGSRSFAIDFTKVDMVTSAGIRVLMMLAKRLGGANRVALWGLNEQVKVVFTIAGLLGLFQVLDSQQAAVAHLTSIAAPTASAVELSKVTRLAMRLLGDSGQAPARLSEEGSKEVISKMTERVSELLTQRPARR
jgi:anti-anti-sigma factor